jgi:DNA helicase HerA-like ATPase
VTRQKYRVEPPLVRRERLVQLGESGDRCTDSVYLGRLAESGLSKDVWLDVTHEHVLAIVGKRGSGKSFTLGSVIEALCTSEHETLISRTSKERGALLFDTLNIFQWMTAPVSEARASSAHVGEQVRTLAEWGLRDSIPLDVDLWVPAGFQDRVTGRAQPFRIRTWEMEASDWASLLGVDAVQDVMGQLLSQVFDKVTKKGWSGQSGAEAARLQYQLADLIDCLANDPDIERDYARESIRAVRQRLSSYDSTDLFGAQGTAMGELVRPGRLAVMLLSGVPDHVRLVIIGLAIRQLLFARAEASEAAKTLDLGFASDPKEESRIKDVLESAPPKAWVFIDEAQNVFPSERQTSASGILLRFVREGRNFGLSLGLTTQQPSAIDSRIMAQVDTLIVHTLTVQRDLQTVLSNLKSRQPDSIFLKSVRLNLSDAVRHLIVGQAFVSSTEATRGFFMDVRPRTSVHGGFEG